MPAEAHNIVYTVGHSTLAIGDFLALLVGHGITAIADVRSSPYSRMNPQFNRETLRASLSEADIEYVFLGEELGARSRDPSCYEEGKVRYDWLARTAAFRRGLERVRKGAAQYRLALMCAEKEPLECHRTILVSRHLEALGMDVRHVVGSGGACSALEPHRDCIARLKQKLKLTEDLFASAEEVTKAAYEIQGERMAYKRPQS